MTYNDLIKAYISPLSPKPTGESPCGALKEKIECILFDIYGTLFISAAGDISLARNATPRVAKIKALLKKYEINISAHRITAQLHQEIQSQHRRLIDSGIDVPEIEIDKTWLQILDFDDIDRAREFSVEYELITNPVFPMPHLAQMLDACKERNCHMGLISNAQFFTPLLFEWFLGAQPAGLGFASDLIFLSYRMGCAKPSLTLFNAAAAAVRSRSIAPHSTLVVGNDLLNDIYPAKQMGFQTALFAGDARSLRLRTDDPRCRNLTADIVLTDLKQLIGHIS